MSTDEQPLGRGVLVLAALVTAALVGTLTLMVLLWPGSEQGGVADEPLFAEESSEPSESGSAGTDSDKAAVRPPGADDEEDLGAEEGTDLRDLTDSALDEADRLRERADEEARELRERAEEEAERFDPLDELRDLFGLGDDEAHAPDPETPETPGPGTQEPGADDGGARGNGPADDGPGRGNGPADDEAGQDDRNIFEDLLDDARSYFDRP